MTPHRLAIPAIALFLFAAGLGTAKASGQSNAQTLSAPASVPVSAQNREIDPNAWDTPPQDLPVIQLKGFRDGITGARKDFDKHRDPNVNDRAEYRSPHLPAEQKDAYRDGFSLGYERGASHFIAGPDQPVPQLEQPLSGLTHSGSESLAIASGVPAQYSEIQRRGFQDGMARARKDMDTHHRADVNDRDESRQQKLQPDLRLQYLAAFSQGYEHFKSLQAGSPLDRH